MNLEELEQQEKALREMLDENINKQKVIHKKQFIEKHGIDIGDTVELGSGYYSKKAVIVKIEAINNPKYFSYVIRRINSKGKMLKREEKIWSYELRTLKLITKAK